MSYRFGQRHLCQHGQRAETGRCADQSPQGGCHSPSPGQTLRCQFGGGHIDPRRGQRGKYRIHRQNQLVQAHAFAAQPSRNIHAEHHAQHPQGKPRRCEQHRVFQIGPDPHAGLLLPYCDPVGDICAHLLLYACRHPGRMVK